MVAQPVPDNSLLATTVSLAMLSLLLLCLYYEARIYRVERRFSLSSVPLSPAEVPQIIINTANMISANASAFSLLELNDDNCPIQLESLFHPPHLEKLRTRVESGRDFALQVLTHSRKSVHLQASRFGENNTFKFHIRLLDTCTSASNPFYRRLLNNLETFSSPAFVTDTAQHILSANTKFTQLSGYSLQELEQQPVAMLRPGIFAEDYYQNLWAQVSAAGHWAGQLWCRFHDGQSHLTQVTISSVLNEQGQTTHYLVVLAPAQAVSHPIQISPANGEEILAALPQQADLESYFQTMTTSADAILVDIYRFQLMRDTFGATTALRLKEQYIQRVKRILKPENYLAQLGRDEFLIVTKQHDPAYTASLARKILRIGRSPIHCDGFDLLVPVNMGIVYYPVHGQSLDSLISAASAAIFTARTRGANQFETYQPESSHNLRENMRLETRLRTAVHTGQLSLHYQPILNTEMKLEKVEALLRWNDPEKGPISPAEFIPIAEQSDLISEIGSWVIQEACRQHAEWRDSGLGEIRIAVNLSSQQLKQRGLKKQIKASLNGYKVDAQFIELEITETTLMEQLERGKSLLRDLKKLGLKLALDDFGTGYSSLAYLSEFPLDTLKVDRSFVQNIGNTEHGVVLDSIIDLAKNLTLRIVAEGVETEDQHRYLLDKQCDFYQGFLFARPMPAAALESQIRQQTLPLSG